jgi:polyphosphate glucokinase
MTIAVGIDIGGTGIKGAVVDIATGQLLTERMKIATPTGGSPGDILDTVEELFGRLGEVATEVPVGVCFPAIVKNGVTMSAANVSKDWIGLEAERLFEERLGRDIHFLNDADAAGIAEVIYGAARDVPGLVLLTTLGTGIGTAMLYNGVLVPNTELGHLEVGGVDIETVAAVSARERENLSWTEWVARLQPYYTHLEFLFSPDLFIVGGGVSKSHEQFLPLITTRAPMVPAGLRNNAGIMGVAWLAVNDHRARYRDSPIA